MAASPGSPSTALELFKARHASHCTVLIFYRGERSFFCKHWLRRWLAIPVLHRRLDLADATLLFVSSQSQGKAFCVADQLAVPPVLLDKRIFFFGDPEHLLVSHLIDLGLPHPVITNPETHRAHGWVFDYGMVQPGIIALAPGLTLLYSWTSKPSLLNVAGKLDRPDPLDVWDCIEHRLDRIRIAKAREERKQAALAESSSSSAYHPLALPGPHGDGSKEYIARDPYAGFACLIPSISTESEERKYGAVGDKPKDMQSETAVGIVKGDRQMSAVSASERQMSNASKDHNISLGSLKDRDASFTSLRERQASFISEGEPLSAHDTTVAPASTNIESLTDVFPRSKEEPDISDGDLGSTSVRDNVSSNINALASEVLRENTLAITPMPMVSQRVAELENKSAQAALDDFADVLASLEAKEKAQRKTDLMGKNASEQMGFTAFFGNTPGTTNPKDGDGNNSTQDERRPQHSGSTDDRNTDALYSLGNKNKTVADMIDANASSSSHMSSRETRGEDDFIGSTQTTRETQSMEQALTHAGLSDFEEYPPDRREPSFGSTGSAQADASLAANKFNSIRTEDSAHVNTLQSESDKERSIVEEAEDFKMGVADYLRELKDPERQSYVIRGAQVLQLGSMGVATVPMGSAVSVEEAEALAMAAEREEEDKMDSPHPEATLTQARIIDVSPFADAEYSFNAEMTKGSLRDEYEAYDEYVVCEFEVEEFVEELESEVSSRSKALSSGRGEEVDAEQVQRVGGVRRVLRMVIGIRGRKSMRDEGERVGRKETLRRVFGKREEEEEEERLGRKETLRSVLRKIPRKKREDDVHRLPSLGCTGGGEKKKIFTRTFSRLRASGVEEEEWEGSGGEAQRGGEKVGEKRSLVGVGGRLLGKLRMS